MKPTTYPTILAALLSLAGACCHDDSGIPYRGNQSLPTASFDMEHWRDSVYGSSPLRARHRETPLKILAIGNSFTINATYHLPWLLERLGADSICVAALTRSGCSLQMHWASHLADGCDYDLKYSDCGEWKKEDILTIDAALTVMDWDVITIQQVSGYSGIYSSFQPYLDHLITLFEETSPDAKKVWHSTWPYRDGCAHPEFYRYDHDPATMYQAILNTAAIAAEKMDFIIPSTDLIWRMREEYPEVTDGFTADGYHISDPHALYALSCLWYELLISPHTGKSSLELDDFPYGVEPEFISRALSIVRDLTE